MNSMIYDDLFRYTGKRSFRLLVRYFLFTPGFRYSFFYRKAQNSNWIIFRLLWEFLRRGCMLRTGIQIPAFIAPNAFFNTDVPDGCLAIRNPAVIVQKEKSSQKYIVYKV